MGSILYLLIGMVLTHTNGAGSGTNEFSYFQFETVSIFLRIGAVGLVLAALSGEKNGLVVVIGLLLVGALIVPTKDMMRMYLAATNSNRNIQEFYGDNGGGPELRGRDPQLAATIVDVLHQAGALGDEDSVMRADLYWLVEEEIVQERVTTLLERTRARGALEVLEKIQSNQILEISHRYGEDERHVSTLRFLRNASLITYTYDDLTDLDVTELGLRVLHQARIDGFSAQRLAIQDSSLFQDCLPLGFDEPVQYIVQEPRGSVGQAANQLPEPVLEFVGTPTHTFRLSARPAYAVIQVTPGLPRSVLLYINDATNLHGKAGDDDEQEERAAQSTGQSPQPVLELYQVNHQTTDGNVIDDHCKVIGTSSPGSYRSANSRRGELDLSSGSALNVDLDPGRYVLKIHDRQQTRGRVTIAVGNTDEVARQIESRPRSISNGDLFSPGPRMTCEDFSGDDASLPIVLEMDEGGTVSQDLTLTELVPTN
ncbi:MAG: hypothetical protein AAF386_11815, partial [Pseudomonadota bacterium]